MNDDLIRDVLSPLRGDEGRPDVDRLVTRGRHAQAAHRRRRGLALGAAAALAAGVVAAALPAGDEPLTARSVLNAAAAAAADQPPERLTGIRYVRIHATGIDQPGWGTEGDRIRTTRQLEFWVPRDGKGRVEFGASEIFDLEGRPIEPPEGFPRPGPYHGPRDFDFGKLDIESLPRDPGAARQVMEDAMRRAIEERSREPYPEPAEFAALVGFATDLLSFASMTPQQRATVLEVLARLPGSRAISEDTVEIEGALLTVGARQATTLVIDRETGALRSRTDRVIEPYEFTYPEGVDPGRGGMAPSHVEYTWEFQVSRDVDAVGDRP